MRQSIFISFAVDILKTFPVNMLQNPQDGTVRVGTDFFIGFPVDMLQNFSRLDSWEFEKGISPSPILHIILRKTTVYLSKLVPLVYRILYTGYYSKLNLEKKIGQLIFLLLPEEFFHVLDMHSSKSINANFHSLHFPLRLESSCFLHRHINTHCHVISWNGWRHNYPLCETKSPE